MSQAEQSLEEGESETAKQSGAGETWLSYNPASSESSWDLPFLGLRSLARNLLLLQ